MGLRIMRLPTLFFSVHHLRSLLGKFSHLLIMCAWLALPAPAWTATTVPMEVQMPGTQPGEAGNLESVTKCDNCHQDSSPVVNIAHDWRGSMMSHAGRDPIYWATVAIAEQDFDGAGDLCIRCHTMGGWLAGQSTPTDASTLTDGQAVAAVGCDVCHKITNPDNSEHPGDQTAPFIANDGGAPAEGYYGSSQLSLLGSNTKLGPYANAVPKHHWDESQFHRSVDFCGSCHDVSNPVVGDLAPNNGAQQPLDPGTFDGQLNTPSNPRNIEDKAAFNNPPYKYGVVERTFSEYKAGLLSQTLVSDYLSLPTELQAGSIEIARAAALGAGNGGDYSDGSARYFSCQTCHMMATTGLGANKAGVPVRSDLPMHDLTGGNYWMPQVMQYMDGQNTLLLGGSLSSAEIDGMNDGVARAQANLENAASLSVTGNTLRVVNLTGHKLISGYPEGRRMWMNIVWKDAADTTIREDGEYGLLPLGYDIDGDTINDSVATLLDLLDPNTRVYESHGAITQEWANKLIAVSASYGSVPVAFDRETGAVTHTVANIAALNPGEYHETFHFVLNNKVVKDNRIPPYGMDYDEALTRSILPVPATQYGNPGPGGTFNYWDAFALNPPAGAVSADIQLMYQPTSWEYIQFLDHANNGSITFLADEGVNILDAWLNTGMAAPHVMASTSWDAPDADEDGVPDSTDNCTNDPNPLQENNDGDALGDACDDDNDNDGLTDIEEENFDGVPGYNPATDTNPFSADTDGDGISDFDELNYDSDPAYNAATDTNPLSDNTDSDAYLDDVDPVPLNFNYDDGDIAPWGAPDSKVNVADLLVCAQLAVGLKEPTNEDLAHGDLYPTGAPDGKIDLFDYYQLQKLLLF
jgi:cytochrome c2